jgi:hypothetical protein
MLQVPFQTRFWQTLTATLGNATMIWEELTTSVGNLTVTNVTVTNYTETLYTANTSTAITCIFFKPTVQFKSLQLMQKNDHLAFKCGW